MSDTPRNNRRRVSPDEGGGVETLSYLLLTVRQRPGILLLLITPVPIQRSHGSFFSCNFRMD